MAIHANSTAVPAPGLLPFDPTTSTLLSTDQLLDLLGGRKTVEATIEGLIRLLDDTDASEEDLEDGHDAEMIDEDGEDLEGDDLDLGEADGAFFVGGLAA